MRELLFGPKRFSDLSRGLRGMSQNVLTQRLRELEESGVVRHRKLGPPVSTSVYELTDRGYDLREVVGALARWGSRIPLPDGGSGELSTGALILALTTTFDPGPTTGRRLRYELRLGEDRFHAEIGSGRFTVARGEADRPDAILDTDETTLRDLIFVGRPLDHARTAGDLHLHGDHEAAALFLTSFSRPVPYDESCAG